MPCEAWVGLEPPEYVECILVEEHVVHMGFTSGSIRNEDGTYRQTAVQVHWRHE